MSAVRLAVLGMLWLGELTRAGAQISAVKPVLRPLPAGTAAIVGLILTDTGEPAAGATISLRTHEHWSPNYESAPPYQPQETVADALGQFAFSGLPGETLELAASMSGFLEAVYGQARPGLSGTPIRLRDNQRLSVSMRLSRGSSIAGTVFDSRGVPASGINVYAFRMMPLSDGDALMGSGGNAVTSNAGEYKMSGLPPGRYVVSAYRVWGDHEPPPVHREGTGGLAVEAAAYFPNARDGDSAEQIDVAMGRRLEGIDLSLRMEPVTTISGTVRDADGQPAAKAMVKLMAATGAPSPVSEATAGPDGVFELARVKAGDYQVVAYSQAGEPHWGEAPFTSDGRTPGLASLRLRPAATVSGKVVFAGQAATPPPSGRFALFLSRAYLDTRDDVPGVRGVSATPTFTYRGVPPGRFVIAVNRDALPSGWAMQSELVAGRDALDFPFEVVADEQIEDVVITLSNQMSELTGSVTDENGAPSPDHTVVVFAADDRFWTPRSRRIEAVRPDTNGRYQVRGLPAGEYVVALATAALYGRPSASLLRELRSASPRISLRVGEPTTCDLRAGPPRKGP